MTKKSEIDWPTVLRMFAGGAMTGAGLSAGTSFIRHLQTLKDQTADTSSDDDVLYLNLPKQKLAPEKDTRKVKRASSATYATGGIAGVVGTILAYNAVRNMYQKSRKKRLQRELDASQNIYLGNLAVPGSMGKQASQFSPLSKGIGSVYMALLLSALGSGVVANRVLQKQFPPIKNPNRGKPRKIVVREQNESGGEEDQIVDKPVTPDAVEGLVRTNLNMPKVANADGSVADLVAAVAAGRGREIQDNIRTLGVETALDLVKGARHTKVSKVNRNLAISWICYDPLVSTAVAPLIAAEFQEGGGAWFAKAAACVPEEYHAALVGLTEAATQAARQRIYAPVVSQCKMAFDKAAETPLQQILMAKGLDSILRETVVGSMVGDGPAPDQSEVPPPETPEIGGKRELSPGESDTPVSKDSTPANLELSNDDARDFWKRNGNLVDSSIAKAA